MNTTACSQRRYKRNYDVSIIVSTNYKEAFLNQSPYIKMTVTKNFKIKKEDIKQLVENFGACLATDKITVEGELVDYMYREEPEMDIDNGWRFLSGTESQEYVDDAKNWNYYDTNTIANYAPAIIPYLGFPIGTELERVKGTDEFQQINN